MEIEYGGINKRYDLFWEGMAFEKENNLQKAIETYIAYADSLAFLDKHIPTIGYQIFMIDLISLYKLSIILTSMLKVAVN